MPSAEPKATPAHTDLRQINIAGRNVDYGARMSTTLALAAVVFGVLVPWAAGLVRPGAATGDPRWVMVAAVVVGNLVLVLSTRTALGLVGAGLMVGALSAWSSAHCVDADARELSLMAERAVEHLDQVGPAVAVTNRRQGTGARLEAVGHRTQRGQHERRVRHADAPDFADEARVPAHRGTLVAVGQLAQHAGQRKRVIERQRMPELVGRGQCRQCLPTCDRPPERDV